MKDERDDTQLAATQPEFCIASHRYCQSSGSVKRTRRYIGDAGFVRQVGASLESAPGCTARSATGACSVNRATLQVARKLVAYLLAVDKSRDLTVQPDRRVRGSLLGRRLE
jgi:hypothetical protein